MFTIKNLNIQFQRVKQSRDKNTQIIFTYLEHNNGFAPVHDKSDPQLISELFGISKGAFKKAISGLYKQRIIKIEKDGIRLIDTQAT